MLVLLASLGKGKRFERIGRLLGENPWVSGNHCLLLMMLMNCLNLLINSNSCCVEEDYVMNEIDGKHLQESNS